jgi:hypothetical protein
MLESCRKIPANIPQSDSSKMCSLARVLQDRSRRCL